MSCAESVRLFCLPYAGGTARAYLCWSSSLPDSIEVVPVEPPGRGERIGELPCSRLDPLLADLVPRIADRCDGPFALFGHSLGAAVAYEIAWLLRKSYDLRPVHLFASAFRAPHLPLTETRIQHLPDRQFLDHIRRLGGTPPEALDCPELMQLLMPAMRADFSLSEGYFRPVGDPLNCPITAFGGVLDTDVGIDELSAWQRHTTARCFVRLFDGDHFFLHTARHDVVRAITEALTGHNSGTNGRQDPTISKKGNVR